eukprot:4347396-Amphidinium_carterae.1
MLHVSCSNVQHRCLSTSSSARREPSFKSLRTADDIAGWMGILQGFCFLALLSQAHSKPKRKCDLSAHIFKDMSGAPSPVCCSMR